MEKKKKVLSENFSNLKGLLENLEQPARDGVQVILQGQTVTTMCSFPFMQKLEAGEAFLHLQLTRSISCYVQQLPWPTNFMGQWLGWVLILSVNPRQEICKGRCTCASSLISTGSTLAFCLVQEVLAWERRYCKALSCLLSKLLKKPG